MRMRHAAYAATFVLLAALAATILLTSATAPQPASAAARAEPHSLAPAPVTPLTPLTPLPTYTLTVTAGPGGSVNPAGATTHTEGIPVTLTSELERCHAHLRRLGRRLQRHGHHLRVGDVRRPHGDGVVHAAAGGPLPDAHRRRLHPRRLQRRPGRLRPGPGHTAESVLIQPDATAAIRSSAAINTPS